MKVVFMGTPEFSVPALDALVEAGHEIIAVYTRAPRPAGRGKKERKSPVHERADELGVPVRTPKTFKTAEAEGAFADLKPDVAVVVAYGLILPVPVLAAPTRGCINIHASLLPRWRGAAPIHRAVMAGDFETGISIMEMEMGLDTGPVLLREATAISETATTGDLHRELSDMGARLVVETLANIDGLTPEPQPDEGATYALKVDKSEARIDWSRTADEIDRQIRSLSPFPGAWCEAGDARMKLLRSRVVDGAGESGQHLGDFRIACGDGAIEVLEAQREGKRAMTAKEVLMGQALPDHLT